MPLIEAVISSYFITMLWSFVSITLASLRSPHFVSLDKNPLVTMTIITRLTYCPHLLAYVCDVQ